MVICLSLVWELKKLKAGSSSKWQSACVRATSECALRSEYRSFKDFETAECRLTTTEGVGSCRCIWESRLGCGSRLCVGRGGVALWTLNSSVYSEDLVWTGASWLDAVRV